ncbi:MAG TPA: penicillin acylase family protein, partial [Thermoanaerobaculia bacterium]|nr:penicillin acylase family protein [Thermoanaerobaculia bacterium]
MSQSISIQFDGAAVPHIESRHERDLAFALGWLHANDRLFQLELARRAAAGRLAELFGPMALASDIRARHLRLAELSDTLAGLAGADARQWLDSYARGVNAWIERRGRDLPPELRLLRAAPEPWRPRDSMAVSLIMAMELSLLPLQAKETRHTWTRTADPTLPGDLLDAAILGTAEPGGSNAFIAHADGRAFLGNDTHLLMRLPPWWFRAHLRAPGFEVMGWTLPGFPAVIAGFNGRIAWGITTHMLDDYDVYLEDWDEAGRTVRRGEERLAVESDEVRIRINRRESTTITRRRTDVGPMLPPDPSGALPARSIAWTALHPGRPMDAMLTLARARTLDEIVAAREEYVAPAMNLLACDRDGRSLFMLLGRVPDRPPALVDPRLPLDASRRELHWRGLRDAAANPLRRLEPGEPVVSGNDEQLRRASAVFYPAEFDSPSRVNRMREL